MLRLRARVKDQLFCLLRQCEAVSLTFYSLLNSGCQAGKFVRRRRSTEWLQHFMNLAYLPSLRTLFIRFL